MVGYLSPGYLSRNQVDLVKKDIFMCTSDSIINDSTKSTVEMEATSKYNMQSCDPGYENTIQEVDTTEKIVVNEPYPNMDVYNQKEKQPLNNAKDKESTKRPSNIYTDI